MAGVTLVVVAWPKNPARISYLGLTLRSLRRHLDPAPIASWLCSLEAGEVSTEARAEATAICRKYQFEPIHHPAPPQLGRHMNWLTQTQLKGLFFCAQEDIALIEPLDLSPAVRLVESGAGQYVRYFVNDKPKLVEDPRYPGFLRPEGLWDYPFGNPQYLAHTDFFAKLGPWRERGGQEKDMTMRLQASGLPVWVAAQRPFVHIGAESAMGHHCAAVTLPEEP